ncbi:SdpI family protein [Actinomadura macrotermitis]|uniref:SdpI family protein n=1 Tax=Actinomadura macrotermitis TaxID=2585200 RepID=A0A7K0C5M4_9ACTN|nr:SdpI family protein [Actinomadura macrotermitis]MQY08124.1 hypothetical protein [Actinomadura macrotermitis]
MIENFVQGGILIGAGVITAAFVHAAATGRLRRNRFSGIRTRRSMADDESWRLVHRRAEPWFLAGALVMAIAGLGICTGPGPAVRFALTMGGVLVGVGLMLAGSALGLAALGRRPPR